VFLIRYTTDEGPGPKVGVLDGDRLAILAVPSMAALLQLPLDDLRSQVETAQWQPLPAGLQLLAPVDSRTEIWASGVTYLRSREARIEESTQQSVYELIYEAPRPELFFKSSAWRAVTDGEPVAVRSDSATNVPEPELAVLANRHAEIIGYLICNDMSSRTLEGENPLYLPQAKVFAGACALSHGIRPVWELDTADLPIVIHITRAGAVAFHGSTRTSSIRRPLAQLVDYLFHSENFPDGAVLSTGTGIVPDVDFSLHADDIVSISIEGLGTLSNRVVVGKENFRFLADRFLTPPMGDL